MSRRTGESSLTASLEATRWGYQFFLKECIVELIKRFPDEEIPLLELHHLCTVRWMMLSNVQREFFQKEAEDTYTDQFFPTESRK